MSLGLPSKPPFMPPFAPFLVLGAHECMLILNILGVDSFSILSDHRSFQKPDPFPLGLLRSLRKKDPWKEWKWKVPLETLPNWCRCLAC